MIYKAFLNRQEITGFPVKGKDVSKIFGGNILLWEKSEKLPMKEICCATGKTYWSPDVTKPYTRYDIVEYSVRNQTEDGKKYLTQNTKAGIFLEYKHKTGQSYSCRAYIMYDGVVMPNGGSIMNVKYSSKRYDMEGNLLSQREEWGFSTLVDKNKPGIYQVGFGEGVSLGLNAYPIEGSATGCVMFKTLDELKAYMGVS